ncbi:MAG: tRNA(Ile)(2)-agmatinylcytidine synthase [Methanotrichaceae archaeon]|nr:tRNA(Ile)(2)-agmatinylcytidine synthase [Methanotrichaceae archaeon]
MLDRYLSLTMFIGIDDTDSERGLCTTYLAAVLMDRLKGLGEIEGLPRLIRLNPCARFKTRGNAAIAFEFETDQPKRVRDLALKTVLELSDLSGENTNPGLVVADRVTPQMRAFYRRAVTEILQISEARDLLVAEGIWHRGLKKGRGLIGALAAVGAELPDFTYELIVYRERQRWGTQRQIDAMSVWEADAMTYPQTWDTVDHHNNRIVFAPHSKDPVLFGIRGSDPGAIEQAFRTIKSEPWERRVLYITNQGTDAHILSGDMSEVKDSQSYRLQGTVAEPPRAIEGGHIFFSLQNGKVRLSCAAFEPTKNFRDVVKRLLPGDSVEVYGAVRDGTLNLEKMNVLHLAEQVSLVAPLCPQCNRRMESAGKGQGYRCRRCKTRAEGRERVLVKRNLETGLYEVPPCARRHLAKPLVRMPSEKVHPSR